jgi:hypothetical protein
MQFFEKKVETARTNFEVYTTNMVAEKIQKRLAERAYQALAKKMEEDAAEL